MKNNEKIKNNIILTIFILTIVTHIVGTYKIQQLKTKQKTNEIYRKNMELCQCQYKTNSEIRECKENINNKYFI